MGGIIVREIDGRIFRNFVKDAMWIEVGHDPKYQYYLTPAGMVVKVLIDCDVFRIVEVSSNFRLG